MTVIDEVRSIAEHTRQRIAIEAHLLKYGSLGVTEARTVGVEGYGLVPHPGARIFELREKQWFIETKRHPTRYVLISAPSEKPEQTKMPV